VCGKRRLWPVLRECRDICLEWLADHHSLLPFFTFPPSLTSQPHCLAQTRENKATLYHTSTGVDRWSCGKNYLQSPVFHIAWTRVEKILGWSVW
jgi:hypothetical protein